jgi:hypothetical protein
MLAEIRKHSDADLAGAKALLGVTMGNTGSESSVQKVKDV